VDHVFRGEEHVRPAEADETELVGAHDGQLVWDGAGEESPGSLAATISASGDMIDLVFHEAIVRRAAWTLSRRG
jgi:hypothetical protein